MRARSVLSLCLVSLVGLAGCRRGQRRVVRDPRLRFATSCEDARFVSAAPAVISSLHTMFPATARLRDRSLTAGPTDGGLVATTGGAALSLGALATPTTTPSVAATDRGFVLAWRDPAGVRAAALGLDGALVRSSEISFCAGDPSVTALGPTALVACVRHVTGEPDAVAVHRVDARGAVELVAATRCPHGDCRAPVIAQSWAGAWVAFISHDSGPEAIFTARLDVFHGRFEAPREFIRPAATVSGLSLAVGGSRVAVAWADNRAGAFALYTSSMSAAGERFSGDQRLSIRHAGDAASLAWDGAAFGIAWSEPVSGGAFRSYFALLDANAMRMGTQMRVYVPDDSAAVHPSLTFTGRGYVLTYAKGDGTVEARSTGPRGCDLPP